jgi:hypothetical protein
MARRRHKRLSPRQKMAIALKNNGQYVKPAKGVKHYQVIDLVPKKKGGYIDTYSISSTSMARKKFNRPKVASPSKYGRKVRVHLKKLLRDGT